MKKGLTVKKILLAAAIMVAIPKCDTDSIFHIIGNERIDISNIINSDSIGIDKATMNSNDFTNSKSR